MAVMHGDNLSYAETFGGALEGLFQPGSEPGAGLGPGGSLSLGSMIQDAQTAFQDYLEHLGQGRFSEAATALERLESLLQGMTEQASDTGGGE